MIYRIHVYSKGLPLEYSTLDYSNLLIACRHCEHWIKGEDHKDFIRRSYRVAWSVFRTKDLVIFFCSDVLTIQIEKIYETNREAETKA